MQGNSNKTPGWKKREGDNTTLLVQKSVIPAVWPVLKTKNDLKDCYRELHLFGLLLARTWVQLPHSHITKQTKGENLSAIQPN